MRVRLRRVFGDLLLVVVAYAACAAFFCTVQRQLLFPLADGRPHAAATTNSH